MGDDLDIYDDLEAFQETEQQKSKELQEWETKFANAQVEINNYQALNKALAKKIKTMEVNFQNLLDTAKAEIKRKDTLIAQLRKEKDDICFRRKAPKGVSKRIIENQQQEPQLFKPDETVVASDVNKSDKRPFNPFKQDPRQEPKRFKLEETVVASDVVNTSDKRYKEIKDDNQRPQEIVHAKKTDHKHGRQSSSDAKSSQERSSSDPKNVHDRDRDRNRKRSRRRSRSRSRDEDGSRNSRTGQSQRSRRSRSRSASRSRSSHRTNNNKTCHRSDSREHETKASTNDRRNKEKTMESLFGKTPKSNSPTIELTNEQKAKVLEKMLANTEPNTPLEQYTPQSVNRSGSNSINEKVTNKQQTEEEINSYFLSNVREIEQFTAVATKGESTDQLDCIVNDIAVSKATKPATEIQEKTTRKAMKKAPETVTKTVEKIPGLAIITNKDQFETESVEQIDFVSNDMPVIKLTSENENDSTRLSIKRMPATATRAIEQIPGLDLINEEYLTGEKTIEQADDASNLEIKATLNEDHFTNVLKTISDSNLITQQVQEEVIERIPSPNIITQEHPAKVECIEHLEDISSDVAKIKKTKSSTEMADETIRQAIEKTEATTSKAIEQIPGLDLINEEYQAGTESIDQPEDASNLEIKATINEDHITNVIKNISDSNLITQQGIAEVESVEHLEGASNDFAEIKTINPATKNKEETNRHVIEKTPAIEQIPGLDLITEDEAESNDQLENASNDILEIAATINEEQNPKETENIPDPNVLRKENQTEVESIEELEKASNVIAEINTTKPAAENEDETTEESPNEKQGSKVIDIEPEAYNTAAEKEPTKTDDNQATSCSDKLQIDDEESRKEFTNCDEQTTTCIQINKTPDHSEVTEAPAVDNDVTPERQMGSASGVQIIEDIRLPVMMEIEDIAETVDRLSGSKEDIVEAEDNSKKDQLKLVDSDKETKNIAPEVSTDDKSNVEVIMYAQPDSTKIDHNENDPVFDAMESLIIPDEEMAKSLDLSLSFEMDNIELTLEQLHQQSHDDEQPDEATVTSTSMKALKQDLIKILTQSPVQEPPAANVSPYPAKLKNKAKKTGARSVSERTTPTKNKEQSSATPERVDKTPLKKRKLNLDDKTEDQVVLQTPPDSAKRTSPSPQHVTIDETLNASGSDNNNSSISNSSIVTKRCSLGNSDYQFERINDEVVLRVTRRARRRRAPVNNN